MKSLKIKQKLNKTIDYCLLIGAITAISVGVYYNVFYYERHRNKKSKRPRF